MNTYKGTANKIKLFYIPLPSPFTTSWSAWEWRSGRSGLVSKTCLKRRIRQTSKTRQKGEKKNWWEGKYYWELFDTFSFKSAELGASSVPELTSTAQGIDEGKENGQTAHDWRVAGVDVGFLGWRGNSPSCVRETGMPRTLPWDGQWHNWKLMDWDERRDQDGQCLVGVSYRLSDQWGLFRQLKHLHICNYSPGITWTTSYLINRQQSKEVSGEHWWPLPSMGKQTEGSFGCSDSTWHCGVQDHERRKQIQWTKSQPWLSGLFKGLLGRIP